MPAELSAQLINWIPIALLIAVWVLISLRMRKPQEESLKTQRQQLEVDERIAQALEELVFLLGRQRQR
ncbi:MAG: hypothetical protein BWY87_01300 [Deltaproteobacteria bacterium ADurb.Bin510]|nr:MAG: hypothetical protein BWY87_01300 [Deltaproteobacteria bacterium ADurb.Bin510]